MERVRWGLLSTATINDELLRTLAVSDVAEVVAVASRDASRAAAYAEQRGIPHSHGSYEALLADPEVDVVYVSVPNGLHAKWTRRALQAGKHVLCEKPFTATAAESEALFDLAAERGLLCAEAVMYRHHPQTARIEELVRSELGALRSLHAAFHYPIAGLERDVRVDADLAGGALRDLGSYCVSIVNLLAGEEPSDVAGSARWHPRGVDIAFSGFLDYSGGATAAFDVSMDSAFGLWLTVHGERGSLRVPNPYQPSRPEIWAPYRCPQEAFLITGGEERTIALTGGDPFRHELEDISRAVRGEPAFVVPSEETVRNMRTIDRLLAAAGAPQSAVASSGSGAST